MSEQISAAPAGQLAAAIVEKLEKQSVLAIVRDDQRAEQVAAIATAFAPDALILFLPASDALPGEGSGATPGNAGRRHAVLARLAETERAALIVSAEAAEALYPPPRKVDATRWTVAVGQTLDPDAFEGELLEAGYVEDERIDEPGEVARRGLVLDLFPADRDRPVRIEFEDDRVTAIRTYDPLTQLSDGELSEVDLFPAAEPALGGQGVALVEHLPGAVIVTDPQGAASRERARGRRKDGGTTAKEAELVVLDPADAVPRFVQGGAPVRAFARFARAALERGDKLVVAGSERDLRFLRRRAAKGLGEPHALTRWTELADAAPDQVQLITAPVDQGWQQPGLSVVAAADLLGSRAVVQDGPSGGGEELLGEAISELRVGDAVVHEDFGIGTVVGLERVGADGGEAIALDYAGGNRRLVPVADAGKLWRYGGDGEAVTLDRLDGSSWEKRRGEIEAAIATSARALVAMAQARAEASAPVIDPDPAAYERFASGFPFTETADQAKAIAAVRADLSSGKPMDRLVVGDVGYGKTEVALRAAALAALAGKQVAVAAPTTVLVRQHLNSFRRRFEGTGLRVEGLSRLTSAADKRAVKAGLADGSVHVVVGTGAVAGKGVDYADLALVVIDEEQRFGTKDKDKLRSLSAGHVLTLSATPIPRTLQSALVGLQDLSLITTPPARRQPIRTIVADFADKPIAAALERERARGGQSFVVVPRIEDMAEVAAILARIVPKLSVVQAHGKLPAAEIDDAMVSFAEGQGDILLATNIIEAGLDVPRANTMIIWRADRFGLSQLHQLRGRVGRGGRRGQILLTTEPGKTLADATVKRLKTLEAFDRLGAGFAISARDLDMRGAGDLVGEAQAGHMKLIGTDLYQHLLERALRVARGEEVDEWQPQLNLELSPPLPDTWLPDTDARISTYGRLARLPDADALDTLQQELEDRFGAMPDEARLVFEVERARLLARGAGIARIDAGPGAIALTPHGGTRIDPDAFGLTDKNGRLILSERIENPAVRLERVVALLEEIANAGD